MSMISEFVEKLRERLGEYEYSHLVEHDTEECLHCRENEDDWCNCRNCFICVWDKAKAIVKELEEEYKDVPDTNNNDWVPCSEKCPPNDTYCLITDYKGDIRIEKHLSGNEWYAGFNYVVAWMPLPEPYKGE